MKISIISAFLLLASNIAATAKDLKIPSPDKKLVVEVNDNGGTKMRYEKEKTWCLSRRLSRWHQNIIDGNMRGGSRSKTRGISVSDAISSVADMFNSGTAGNLIGGR